MSPSTYPAPPRRRSVSACIGVTAAVVLLFFLGLSGCSTPARREVKSGPWHVEALMRPPVAVWGATTGLVQEVYYQGEPFQGAPTRVFAYLGRPAGVSAGRRPAMLLVHGGGGKAFKDWAAHWAARGYVALAMDLAGNGPSGRLADGGPDQRDETKFRNFGPSEVREMWTYHAVAAVLRGHGLLASLPDVDPDRIGVTGISWGGYLTCIIAGIDPRLRVAVPVYGCGFLAENSVWKERSFPSMNPDARSLWVGEFDPGQYLAGVRCPILFLNGTTDFAYPLDSYQKSYRLVRPELRTVSVVVNLPHGHIWTFPEVDAFVDGVLRKGGGLVRVGPGRAEGGAIKAEVSSPGRVGDVFLHYTTDVGAWQQRVWKTVPGRVEGGAVTADLPEKRPLVCFLGVTDKAGHRTSSEHVVLE